MSKGTPPNRLVIFLTILILLIALNAPWANAAEVISLPAALCEIEERAFYGNSAITFLAIPDGVQRIGTEAFADCSRFKVVRIPASVTEIAPDAFARCHSSFMIHGFTGSYAERYAQANGIPFYQLDSAVEHVVQLALAQLNKPYVWGTEGPDSYDCSGLTSFCYQSVGITLPRSAKSVGENTTGIKITDPASVQRGDVLCFASRDTVDRKICTHVGLYLGDNTMVHASSSQKKVIVTALNTTYWNDVFLWAWRVV